MTSVTLRPFPCIKYEVGKAKVVCFPEFFYVRSFITQKTASIGE